MDALLKIKPAATVMLPNYYDACRVFYVFIIHRTQTWTTGFLMRTQMLMHATAQRGVRTNVRESELKVDMGRKIPCCCTRKSNLREWRASLMLYQLSYIPTPRLNARNSAAPPPQQPHQPLYLLVCWCAWMLGPASRSSQWAGRSRCPSCTGRRWCCTGTAEPTPAQTRRSWSGTSSTLARSLSEGSRRSPATHSNSESN